MKNHIIEENYINKSDKRRYYWELIYPEKEVFKDYVHQYGYLKVFIPTNYEVSNFGRVRNKITGKILSNYYNIDGYLFASLRINGRSYRVSIHKMVGSTFVGFRPNRQFVYNHIDGQKDNPSAYNLEVITHRENIQHAIRNNLFRPDLIDRKGTNNGRNLYSEETVHDICKLLVSGKYNETEVSELMNVPEHLVHNICFGVTWKEIHDMYDFSNVKKKINKKYVKGKRLSKEEKAGIRRMFNEDGKTRKEIAAELNMPYTSVVNIINGHR